MNVTVGTLEWCPSNFTRWMAFYDYDVRGGRLHFFNTPDGISFFVPPPLQSLSSTSLLLESRRPVAILHKSFARGPLFRSIIPPICSLINTTDVFRIPSCVSPSGGTKGAGLATLEFTTTTRKFRTIAGVNFHRANQNLSIDDGREALGVPSPPHISQRLPRPKALTNMAQNSTLDPEDLVIEQYLHCLADTPHNSDMQGYAVRLSTFVVNLCIAILVVWSKEQVVQESVKVLNLQNFVVLVCSTIAMARRDADFSVADAHFALTLTISPAAIYFVYSTYRFIRRRPNHLYDRLGSAKVIMAITSIILLISWIAFDLAIYHNNAFKDDPCMAKAKVTMDGWTLYQIWKMIAVKMLFSMFLVPLIPLFWILYFFRHFKDIRREYRRHMNKNVEPWKYLRWVQRVGRSTKSFLISQWDVITRSHKWIFFLTILIFYISWGSALALWAPDIKWWYCVLLSIFDPDAEIKYGKEDYEKYMAGLSYGQLLAVAIAIEPTWNVLKLFFFRRWDIVSWLKQWPQSIWNGIVFIFTGHRNPWKKILDTQRTDDSEGSDYERLTDPHGQNPLEASELPISKKQSFDQVSFDQAVDWNKVEKGYDDKYRPL
ncbi:hypothetical protein L218DRAFT_1076633 [Marasmius fiardii PR-910]|nr:hypothetical protein L218DRAFT_1076633 [Marasmius fiardii PR-910]